MGPAPLVTDSKAHGGLASLWASDKPTRRLIKMDARTRESANKGKVQPSASEMRTVDGDGELADAGRGGRCPFRHRAGRQGTVRGTSVHVNEESSLTTKMQMPQRKRCPGNSRRRGCRGHRVGSWSKPRTGCDSLPSVRKDARFTSRCPACPSYTRGRQAMF